MRGKNPDPSMYYLSKAFPATFTGVILDASVNLDVRVHIAFLGKALAANLSNETISYLPDELMPSQLT